MYRLLQQTWFADPSGALIVSVFLFFVGLYLSGRRPTARPWGGMLAIIAGCSLVAEHFLFGPLERQITSTRLVFLAVMTTWLALGPAWISCFLLSFVWQYFFSILFAPFRSLGKTLVNGMATRRRIKEEQQKELLLRREEERLRPERDRQAKLIKEREQAQATYQALDKRTRLQSRSLCEFAYAQHCPAIAKVFPPEEFEKLLDRYLGQEIPFDLLEENSRKLQSLIQVQAGRTGSEGEYQGLTGMIKWFNKEKRKIEELDLPPDEEEMVMATLESRMAQLQEETIRAMKPGQPL